MKIFACRKKKDEIRENSFQKTENPSPPYGIKHLLKNTVLSEKWKKLTSTSQKISLLRAVIRFFLKSLLPPNFKIFNRALNKTIPANIRLDEDLLKTSWRRLQDVLIKTNIFTLLIRLQKTSSRPWSRPIYSSWSYVFKTSCQDVFKMSWRRLHYVFRKRLKHVFFKMSSRRLQDIFNTYC